MPGHVIASSGAVFITDLDGTLLSPQRKLLPADRLALARLGEAGVVRVVATGRSLYSFFSAVPPDIPIDYLIFSTGAGVLDFPRRRLLRRVALSREQARDSCLALREMGVSFSLHDPVPDNHRFSYHRAGGENQDFSAYLDRYRAFARPLAGLPSSAAGQLLAIARSWPGDKAMERLSRGISSLNLVRATSPVDHRSSWIEILGPAAGKAKTAQWLLSEHLGLASAATCAVGNDYNDLDLLRWAGTAWVTQGAPDLLKEEFQAVATEGAVARAAGLWMKSLGLSAF